MRRAVLLAAAFGALSALLSFPSPAFGSGGAERTRAIVDSGHAGSVRWIQVEEKRGLLFSAGEDGTVRIWDPVAGNLMHTLQVTQLSAGRIAVNPAAPQVAVVITDGSTTFLAVWDWEKERPLYRVPLKEDPTFLRFSPQGTYVLYGESS